ncbi:ATP-binding protein [Flaviflagellibacter deserti]|uniref:histidine kinase n=1 Tax=Flaviflagellibacter deserti TaxID=2267266 RepID=A0ABV9Z029_9HYPH
MNSLASRLLLAATLCSMAILLIAGFTLSSTYRDLVERGFDARLGVYLRALVGDLSRDGEFEKLVFTVGEPRFEIPLSGWYWQISKRLQDREPEIRSSSSLFDRDLPFLIDSDPEKDMSATREAYTQGPDDEALRQVERVVQIGDARYVVAVAGPTGEIDAETHAFDTALTTTFILLGISLVSTAALQVGFGLRPLTRISRAIADIRAGRAERLEGNVPREIAPLARELNGLLDSNREIVARARTQAGNLAHALKTPLSVIVNEAHASPGSMADKVVQQVDIMRQQIDHHLDRARISAGVAVVGAATEVGPVVEGIARVIEKVQADRKIAIEVTSEPVSFRGDQQDLEEMVGNLLDNAGKWASRRISVRIQSDRRSAQDHWVRITVDDDGPGLTPEQRESALKRGKRLDETKPGSGLGLSIVADLVRIYGGLLTLGSAPLGGLRAELRLPAI